MKYFALTLLLFVYQFSQAQNPNFKKAVAIKVTPDHTDWNYKINEIPNFHIAVTDSAGKPINCQLRYTYGPEKMQPFNQAGIDVVSGQADVTTASLKQPGVLRFTAEAVIDGKKYTGICGVAFEPDAIRSFTTMPDDFQTFWDKNLAELKRVPLNETLRLLKDRSSDKVDVYELSVQTTMEGARVFGILCVPKAEGKYPAVLRLPGAGIRAYNGDKYLAEKKGVITLEIGIHGIPVTMEKGIYENLRLAGLGNYFTFNLDNKDQYYFKRVYLSCVRALDYLCSMKNYDGQHLAVSGASQGGALAVVTAALDPRVKCLTCTHPAMSDLTAYLNQRAGGWPNVFSKYMPWNNTPEKINTTRYYDAVNFARLLKVPGLYTWGYNDDTCPPTSVYALYNSVNAPKKKTLYLETGHFLVAAQSEEINKFLLDYLTQ